MKNEFGVTFFDTTPMPESDRFIAEDAYREALLGQVPNVEILEMIYLDDIAGGEAE